MLQNLNAYSFSLSILGLYLCYKLVMWLLTVPRLKRHYSKYPNVVVNKNAHFIYGEYYDNQDQYEVNEHIETMLANPGADIIIKFEWMTPVVYLCSHNSIKEFKKLIPTKIDRGDAESLTFGKVYSSSFDKSRSTHKWLRRKKMFFQHGDIKRPDPLIPMFIKCTQEVISGWKIGEKIDFREQFANCMQKAILFTIFGDTFYEEIGECKIFKPDGTYKYMDFPTAMQVVDNDVTSHSDTFTSLVLPWVNSYNLVEPFRTDDKNIKELYRVLMEYLTKHGKERIFEISLLKVSSPFSIHQNAG